MSEAILAKDWLPQVELAFEKLKAADIAEREEFCEIIREDEGPEAERELRAKLTAHDQAMQAKFEALEAKPAKSDKIAPTPLIQPHRIFRRPLKSPSEAAAPKPLAPPIAPSEPTLVAAKPEAITVAAEAPLTRAEPQLSSHALSLLDRRPSNSSYAPGLLGEIVDYVVNSAMYPSQTFATAVGLGVVGTLISRRIAGPSGPQGTGTHLYQVIIGPTGSSKEHVRTTGKLLMIAANASGLIGPGRFKSGAGIIKYLQKKPVSLCFMDELGAYFAKLGDPRASIYEREANEILREIWGLSWGRYDSPQGAHDDSEAVLCPALSCLGMSTPKELYRACKSRDVASGFLNRWLFAEEKAAPPYRKVSEGTLEIGKDLRQRLAKLYQPISLLDNTGKPSFRMNWGPGAEEVYEAIRNDVEKETDERRRELFWRSPEKTVRVATIIAAGCFDKSVTRGAMEFAREWVRKSDETLLTGVAEYMEEEKLEFSELCREIIRRVRQAGGTMKHRDVGRSFQNNLRYKRDLQSALDHLVETSQLTLTKEDTGGRPSIWYRLEKEEEVS